ncbi:MAG: HRDC domain-containing protein [Saccharomonospora viridis]|uniref:Ribonuclease D n=1 Tax=Saccharomonospora viridis (strain ATCC 15386 / DSM 43017 / JCM 3036 / CCUG 5913 / NBRC 12207 / NCIMB 9602 / P101) TaxID=471857 RepID=C7MYI9_SACVD|nr:ribonuclease D [Saccharomonospora viridis]ACU97408.1 ribonuclease D [Saccharomonospora viridis DSM 43017]
MDNADHSSGTPGDSAPLPLTEPAEGTPDVIADPDTLRAACERLAEGSGALAVDTERASGYRYWPKAYLIQIRREGAGTFLIDPIPLRDHFTPLAEVMNQVEWVLHAASQDLPCLAELGLHPPSLFDTELAGRLAGYQRVALGTLVESLLGYQLEKGHSAADWSRRPLPLDWLNYAALDVELLLPLREKLEEELAASGKLEWARQEFEAVRTAKPPAPRAEPWRRTSGIHKVRTARGLAAVRALWEARDELARRRDRAPGRILPDSAIINAVLADARTSADLEKLPVFRGRVQRKQATHWLRQLQRARTLPESELPSTAVTYDGPPPPNRWAEKNPDAAARLAAAKAALADIAERNRLPVENLLLPELVRRLCWQPPEDTSRESVATALAEGGARPWQIELTAAELSKALRAQA